ncbi:MAG: o-succinylbenzoate---CoA ligase [Actinomycetota bacterium]|nr:o-succinylbenzoate---CoA ligase [Actinomycetota bacterium]
MPGSDETAVVAVIAAGHPLAVAAISAWDAGEAILPINPAAPPAERNRLLEQLRPTHLVEGETREALRGGIPAPAGTAAIVVTSGTTAEPKGVELTRAGMEVMGRGYSAGLRADADDRWLTCLPLHHVASLGALARAYVTGASWVAHERFDIDRVARSPREEGTTIVSLVPTTLLRLLDAGAPLDEFRRVIIGGAPLPDALRTRAESTGVAVADAYGLSETWGGFALDGIPIAGIETRLDRETAEILVKGAPVMRGYRLDAPRTAEVLDADGWLHTGDIGEIGADGRLRVVDRAKDLVISGGVNVSPTEVEHILGTHPAVDDVCVIGVPDAEWGERVVAFVVPVPGSQLPTLEDLRAFAADQLAAPKLPRELRVVETIPRSTGGKALRRFLRDA